MAGLTRPAGGWLASRSHARAIAGLAPPKPRPSHRAAKAGPRFADVEPVRPGLLAATALLISAIGISTWLAAANYPTIPPRGDFHEREAPTLTLTGADGKIQRRDALRRATFVVPAGVQSLHASSPSSPLRRPVPSCQFAPSEPSGTTPKFDCVFADGPTVKVKYGHDAEIHGEAAATALLRMLGYGADTITIVPRLRCYGCPRHPFVAAVLRRTFFRPFVPEAIPGGYTDFEWVSVEQKFPAPAIETDALSGWEWRELDRVDAPRAEVDAFRILAAFLAHWDNKSENQRLVCLDQVRRPPSPDPGVVGPGTAGTICEKPLAMIQDLGASFGPPKVNLARWRDLPVWYDRTTCTLSMRALPFEGATFEDVAVSEEGRVLAAQRLSAVTDEQIERLFAEARFPQFQAGTADERDLKVWTNAFKSRVMQIAAARCPF